VISRQAVIDACLTRLVAVEANTALTTAPTGTPALYGVLEVPPGGLHDEGTLADTGAHLMITIRVRSVSRNQDLSVATHAALDLAGRYETGLVGEFTGTGWKAKVTALASAGADPEGQVVNVVDDYQVWAVPA